ncbi:MAG: DUF58 domain-containing protein [Burkholderiaceae bacterium]
MRSLNPLNALRSRVRAWWLARLPRTDTWLLTQRNIYILPTGAGWMLAVTLLVLLVASINYQLNLGYLLTFLLAGSAVVGMHLCHGTLRGLRLHLLPPQPQFLGQSAMLEVQLHSSRPATRYGLALATQGDTAQAGTGDDGLHWVWCDVPGQGQTTVQIGFKPTRRGLHPLPLVVAETRFPLGTFRAWTHWRPAAELLVYPAPEPNPPPLPPGEPRTGAGAASSQRGAGEFDGVRAYRRGDPLKLVVWKKAAKSLASGTDELVSRDAQQTQQYELWLDVRATGLAEREARLSRLTAWVLQADKLGLEYGLRVDGLEIAPDSGSAHQRRCLETLALC